MAELLKKARSKSGRRALAGIFSAVLTAGVLMLPASPAAAYTCKVNSIEEPSESDVQDLFDDASVATVTFYGHCDGSWTVERSVSIVGSGTAENPATLTPDGDSILHIHGPANVSISGALEFLEMDAYQGGGIYADGATITMSGNIYFSYSEVYEGGAIYLASGSLTYTAADTEKYLNDDGSLDWDVAEFWCNGAMGGGAIFVAGGTLTINNADFANSECNESYLGGAVFMTGGSATFNNVRVIDNYAVYGAGMAAEGSAVMRVNNSYFESNNAGSDGGAFHIVDGGSLTLANSTVVGSDYDGSGAYRGAGIYAEAEGSVSVTGSTFDELATGDDGGAWGGAIYHDGNNLKVDRSTFTGNHAFGYGGAIFADAGSDTVVTNSTFTGNFADDLYDDSFGGAIAGVAMDLFTISGSTFTGNGYDPEAGESGDVVTTDGGAIAFVEGIGIAGGGGTPENVSISRSTFTDNWADDDGGAIALDEVGAVISLSTFTRNTSYWDGGAVYAIGDDGYNDLTIQTSTFTGNVANTEDDGGGAVYTSGPADVTVTGSKFTGNFSDEDGGAVYAEWFDNLKVSGSTFTSNNAHGSGGGLFAYNEDGGEYGNVTIDKSTFTSNSVDGGGAGAYVNAIDVLRISGSTFTKNVETDNNGGALKIWDTDMLITGSTFTSNSTPGDGGAIWFNDDDYSDNLAVIEKTTVRSNSSGEQGGGIYVDNDYDLQMRSVSILSNRAADDGGGLAVDSGYGLISIDAKSKIDSNVAGWDGGGIWVVGYDWDMDLRGSVSGNTSGNDGGGLFFDHWFDEDDAYLDITAAKIERNTASYLGGGIYVDGNDDGMYVDIHDTLGKVSIAFNKTTNVLGGGGGIYVYDAYQLDLYTMLDNTARVVINRNQSAYGGGLFAHSVDYAYADYGVRFTYNSQYAEFECGWDVLWDTNNATYIGNTPSNQGSC